MSDLREAVARAIAAEVGDGFDSAFADKGEWIDEGGVKGGRFRDVNEPKQADYLAAADAALAAIEAAGFVVVDRNELSRLQRRAAMTTAARDKALEEAAALVDKFDDDLCEDSTALSTAADMIRALEPRK